MSQPLERSPWRRVSRLSHQRTITMAMAMGMVIGMIITTMGIGMIIDGLTMGTIGITTIGMIMDPDGLTVLAVVLVGIRVTERMSPRGMALTLIPASAIPRGMAGIHAPTIIMGIKARPTEGLKTAVGSACCHLPEFRTRLPLAARARGSSRLPISAIGYRC